MSLANTTGQARKFGFVILMAVFACGLFSIFRLGQQEIGPIEEIIVPDNAFGELPIIEPTKINYPTDGVTYEINTTDGQLPKNIPNIVFVYQFKDPIQDLTAKKTAQDLAKKMGFNANPVATEGNYYKWVSIFGTKTLEYDLLKKTIIVETDITKDPFVKLEHQILANNEFYKEKFLSYIARLQGEKNIEDYALGDAGIEYLILDNGKFVPTISASSRADFVKLDFYRKVYAVRYSTDKETNVESLSLTGTSSQSEEVESRDISANVVGRDPYFSFLSGIIGGSEVSNNSVFKLYVNLKQIDYEKYGKYEIFKVEDAYKQLTAGEGILVSITGTDLLDPKIAKTFSINDVSLAYYETEDFSKYLQPIYIFTGIVVFEDNSKGTFNFYVPAIKR